MDDFDPEVMRELLGNLEAMNAAMGPLAVKMGQMTGSIDAAGNAVNKEGEALKANVKYREGESKAVQASRKAQTELKAASDALSAGFSNLKGATASFAEALLKGEGQFSSYNKALDGLGDAAWAAGKAFGPLGMAIGGAVKAITAVAQEFTKQADAQNQFVTQMYQMGAITGQNSETLTDMARAAGYAYEDLEKMGPIFKAAGQGLTTLGGTAGEGTKTFGKLLKAANDNERAFYRIGYSLEELQETQGAYLELQRQSGINLMQRGIDDKKLAKDSLKYAENLRVLSDLTGKSAETLQAEQLAARNAYENVIANRKDEAQIRQLQTQLAQETNAERRAALQKEIDDIENNSAVRNEAIGRMSNQFGKDFGEQFGKILRTGAFDESTKGLAVLGLSAANLKRRFEGVKEGTPEFDRLMAETAQEIRQKQDERISQFGTALQFGGEQLGDALGLAKESVMQGGLVDPQDEAARQKSTKDEIFARMQAGDKQRDAAAALIDTERSIRTSADAALDALNPLTNGFDKATLALEAMTVAVGVAAAAMGMSAFSGAGGGGGMFKGLGNALKGPLLGVGKTLFTKAGAMASPAMQSVAKLAGPLAAVVEIGKGVFHAVEGRDKADENFKKGLITESQQERRKTQATAEGAGQAVGGAGGAAIGAMIGTALLPGVGTIVGGMIGGWLGSKAGDEIGGAIGENMTITPEMEEYNRANLDLVNQMGIYNEKGAFQDSEVNWDALQKGVDEGTVTKDMIQSMMMDNDVSDETLQALTELAATMEGPGVDALTAGASADELAAMIAEREQREKDVLDQQKQAIKDKEAADKKAADDQATLLAEQKKNELEAGKLLREQRLADQQKKQADDQLAKGTEEANTTLALLSGTTAEAMAAQLETSLEFGGEELGRSLGLEKGMMGDEIGKSMTPLMAAMFPGFGVLPSLFEKVSNYLAPDEEAEDEGGILDMAKKAAMAIPGVGLLASAAEGLMGMFSSEPDLDTVEGRRELFAEGTDEDWEQQRGGALGGYTEHLANELELVGLDAASATEEQMAAIKEKAKRSFLDDKYGTEITSNTVHEGDLAGNEMFTDYITSVNALGEILTTKITEKTGADGTYGYEEVTEYGNTVEGSLDRADGTYAIADGVETMTGDFATHEFVDVWNSQVMPGLTEVMAMNSQQLADALQEKEMESADEETTATDTEATQFNQTNVNIEQLLAQNAQLMNMMENRLGSVVSKLEDANDIQSKILQYGRV